MSKLYYNYSIVALAIVCSIIIFLFFPNANLYDYFKQKRLEYYNQKQFEKNKIICPQCRGSGKYPTDVNKLMMDASLVLFINKHLMVDKCKKCVKLEGDSYNYCDVVNDRYKILLQEYGAAGPKIQMTDCDNCMGMGSFTIQNKDGSYMTQEKYDEEHKRD